MTRDERIAELREKLDAAEERTQRIWAKNAFVDIQVYKAPTDLLILNPSNRRFRAEAQEAERDLGHGLDPLSSAEDEESVVSLLLDSDPHIEGTRVVGKPSKDTKGLMLDWDKRGQESPLWIRPDGLVSNGNRRLAMLKRLQADKGKEGYDWVDVVILDEDTYDDDTVFRMEAVEQLTEGFKVRYSDLNALLTLKDAAEKLDVDWHDQESIEETAKKIQDLVGNNANYAKTQLQAIKYMTAYLEWLGRREEYPLLLGQVERFRAMGTNMARVAKDGPAREADMLEVCFQAVSVGTKHGDLRQIRIMLNTEQKAFEDVVGEVSTIADEADEADEAAPLEVSGGAELNDHDEDDEEEGEEKATSAASLSPKKTRIKRALDVAVQASRDSQDTDHLKHVRIAGSRLDKVDAAKMLSESSGTELTALRETIEGIIEWARAAQEALDEQSAGSE